LKRLGLANLDLNHKLWITFTQKIIMDNWWI